MGPWDNPCTWIWSPAVCYGRATNWTARGNLSQATARRGSKRLVSVFELQDQRPGLDAQALDSLQQGTAFALAHRVAEQVLPFESAEPRFGQTDSEHGNILQHDRRR